VTETFEVGQKVTIHGDVEAEITYGPFRSTYGTYTGYVVRIGETERLQRAGDLSAVPVIPKFSVGDVVNLTTRPGAKATVEYGPFDDRDVYVVKLIDEPADDNPRTFTALASVMKPLEPAKVGDRVRVVRDSDGYRSGQFVGRVGVLERVDEYSTDLPNLVRFGDGKGLHGDDNGRWWCAQVERVADDENTYTYDGITYDLTAKYRDKDGDVWEFGARRENGEPRVYCSASGYDDLETVLDAYGPLTRITD
jgi:ribosomal protein L21E